jgi:DNA-binding MarR family transcriptional regulator
MDYNIVDTIMMLNEQCCHISEIGVLENSLTAKELHVIQSLNYGESVSSSDLARRNVLSPSRMSRIIDKLATQGYLSREIDDIDRRFSRVSLTPEGMLINNKVSDFRKQCEAKIKSKLSDHEFAVIQKALHLLRFAMENDYGYDSNDPVEHH